MTEDLNFVLRARREKLDALEARGVTPFGYSYERTHRAGELAALLDSTKSDVSFGSQIRSYVFQPYTMVNDHRTELKIPDVQKVMDGWIDPFVEAYLKQFGAPSGAGKGA